MAPSSIAICCFFIAVRLLHANASSEVCNDKTSFVQLNSILKRASSSEPGDSSPGQKARQLEANKPGEAGLSRLKLGDYLAQKPENVIGEGNSLAQKQDGIAIEMVWAGDDDDDKQSLPLFSDDSDVFSNQDELVAAVIRAWTPEEVDKNWFKAKDNYMFKFNSQLEGKDREDAIAATDKMVELVRLRSLFLCWVVLGAGPTVDCLHDDGKALHVPIPATIPAVGSMTEEITFTELEQACWTAAQGSVTSLSDLDFTVSCKGRVQEKDEHQEDSFKDQALAEVHIAQALTLAVQQILDAYPGHIFDTNFYTTTPGYSEELRADCDENPVLGVAVGLYAAARGLHAVGAYRKEMRCDDADIPTIAGEFRELTDELRKMPGVFYYDMTTQKDISYPEVADQMQDIYSKLEKEQDVHDDATRTNTYYNLLAQAINDPSEFCLKSALGLIYANEAYWNAGAIRFVLESGQHLSKRQGVESVLMNIGYELEHLIHEMSRGDEADLSSRREGVHSLHEAQSRDAIMDVAKCNYGDAFIKFGKYMMRVKGTLQKIQVWEHFLGSLQAREGLVVQDVFLKAADFLGAKKRGGKQEARGAAAAEDVGLGVPLQSHKFKGHKIDYLRGLPKAYLAAYNHMGSHSERCAFFDKIVTVAKVIIKYLMKNYSEYGDTRESLERAHAQAQAANAGKGASEDGPSAGHQGGPQGGRPGPPRPPPGVSSKGSGGAINEAPCKGAACTTS